MILLSYRFRSHRPYSHKLLTINNYVIWPSNFAFARSICLLHPPIFEKILMRIWSVTHSCSTMEALRLLLTHWRSTHTTTQPVHEIRTYPEGSGTVPLLRLLYPVHRCLLWCQTGPLTPAPGSEGSGQTALLYSGPPGWLHRFRTVHLLRTMAEVGKSGSV